MLLFSIFKRLLRKGAPLSTRGFADGLRFMERAWRTLTVHKGHVDWQAGRPMIMLDELENELRETIAEDVHPWKLRWNADDEAIECFAGDVDVYDAGNSITPGVWSDTGLTVSDPGSVQVWLMVTYETSQPGILSASFQYSGGVPAGHAIALSYYIATVNRDGAVTIFQSRRSDMDQKLDRLTAGNGLAMREANRDRDLYDGSDEAEISLDTASDTFTNGVSGVVTSTDHNSLANIENIGTQTGEEDVHSHIVPQEWTGSTLQDLIDALVTAGVLYLPEEE
jgi:hypothetical protein